MAGGMDLGQSSGKGKKPLDTAINLVPFIDLMAVTISFLIMTAVWTQLGRLQVASSGASTAPDDNQDKTPPLTLVLTEKQLQLSAGGTVFPPFTITRDKSGLLDLTAVNQKLKEIKTQIPEEQAITVQTADQVHYQDLVRVIDQCIGDGLPNVSVSPMSS